MATWVCGQDGVRYAVGAPFCPECGADEPYEEGDETMAKISREAGASDVAAEQPEPAAPADVIHGAEPAETEEATETAEPKTLEQYRDVAEEVNARTVGDVLFWVGDNAERAALMLDVENARPTPRSTVTGPLTSIVDKATAPADGTGE